MKGSDPISTAVAPLDVRTFDDTEPPRTAPSRSMRRFATSFRRACAGRLRRLGRSERGSVLVLVALTGSVIVAFAALAIDVGMLMTARDEAQRAADAAALAGASAFLDTPSQFAVDPAKERARLNLGQNTVRNAPIDTAVLASTAEVDSLQEAVVEAIPSQYRVRVTVRRPLLQLWFARIFGVDAWGVSATATAEATDAGAADCVKPFAVPDAWYDANEDTNLNHVWDPGEAWVFGDSPGDRYEQALSDGSNSASATGYGSDFRSDYVSDFGREVTLKVTDPNDVQQMAPSIFLPWRMPNDPNMAKCQLPAGGKNDPGAASYRLNICSCNTNPIIIGQPYQVETGDMKGPTFQGVRELIADDPDATWDADHNQVVNSLWGDRWRLSPRVIKVGVFDPGEVDSSGMQTLVFNNIALFFLEGQQSSNSPVIGRFLYYAQGIPGPNGIATGSLLKRLRLVH